MTKEIIKKIGISELNEMQKAFIDAYPSKNDLILLSPTGTGKTLAYLIPLFQSLDKDIKNVQAMIIVPTRELALQIEQVFKTITTDFKVNCCYGGHSAYVEKKNLSSPPAVIIGTPGRLLAHIEKEYLETSEIHTLVLDEFDKSLEFGFQEEMKAILIQLNNIKKRILTSATNLTEIPDFVNIKNPKTLDFLSTKDFSEVLTYNIIETIEKHKVHSLEKLMYQIKGQSILFCNHREAVERISNSLKEMRIPNVIFHGGMEQAEREEALIRFRNKSSNILICTDLAARGLDIPEIQNIIHYQLPVNEESFIHRNGRTARINNTGDIYIFLTQDEYLPEFINTKAEKITLSEDLKALPKAKFITLKINKGKKDKVNKIDFVGLLTQKGNLPKENIGLIEVKDFCAYIAVKNSKINELIKILKEEKIKNKSFRVEVLE